MFKRNGFPSIEVERLFLGWHFAAIWISNDRSTICAIGHFESNKYGVILRISGIEDLVRSCLINGIPNIPEDITVLEKNDEDQAVVTGMICAELGKLLKGGFSVELDGDDADDGDTCNISYQGLAGEDVVGVGSQSSTFYGDGRHVIEFGSGGGAVTMQVWDGENKLYDGDVYPVSLSGNRRWVNSWQFDDEGGYEISNAFASTTVEVSGDPNVFTADRVVYLCVLPGGFTYLTQCCIDSDFAVTIINENLIGPFHGEVSETLVGSDGNNTVLSNLEDGLGVYPVDTKDAFGTDIDVSSIGKDVVYVKLDVQGDSIRQWAATAFGPTETDKLIEVTVNKKLLVEFADAEIDQVRVSFYNGGTRDALTYAADYTGSIISKRSVKCPVGFGVWTGGIGGIIVLFGSICLAGGRGVGWPDGH